MDNITIRLEFNIRGDSRSKDELNDNDRLPTVKETVLLHCYTVIHLLQIKCYTVILLHCYIVKLIYCHIVVLLYCYIVVLLYSYVVMSLYTHIHKQKIEL